MANELREEKLGIIMVDGKILYRIMTNKFGWREARHFLDVIQL